MPFVQKGRTWLLTARAQVGKRHKKVCLIFQMVTTLFENGVLAHVYNSGLRLLALWGKNF